MPFVVANDYGIWEFFKLLFETTKEGYSPVEKKQLGEKSKAGFTVRILGYHAQP
jgi:hypothetical protein